MTRLFAAAAVALAVAGPALAETIGVRFQNDSSAVIYSIEASPVDHDSWGGDLLQQYVLNPGQGRDVIFTNVTNCLYDVRITFTDGSSLTDVMDVCSYGQYTVN